MYEANERFGTMLKEGRLSHQLTALQLSDELGLSLSYERDLERSKATPSLDVFCRVMRRLNLSADDYVYPEKADDGSAQAELRRIIKDLDDRQLTLLLDMARQMQQAHS